MCTVPFIVPRVHRRIEPAQYALDFTELSLASYPGPTARIGPGYEAKLSPKLNEISNVHACAKPAG